MNPEWWSTHGPLRKSMAPVAILRSDVSRIGRGGKKLRALPKNCHGLPSAAIFACKNRCYRFNQFNGFLAIEDLSTGLDAYDRNLGERAWNGATGCRIFEVSAGVGTAARTLGTR